MSSVTPITGRIHPLETEIPLGLGYPKQPLPTNHGEFNFWDSAPGLEPVVSFNSAMRLEASYFLISQHDTGARMVMVDGLVMGHNAGNGYLMAN